MENTVIRFSKEGDTFAENGIQSAIDNSNVGDAVVVYPGTYNENITLKNGVAMWFMPNTIVSGSSLEGTVGDGSKPVVTTLDGRVSLYNSNGSQYNRVFKNGHTKVVMYNVFDEGIVLNGSLDIPRKGNLTMTSVNGTKWKIIIDNTGNLTTSQAE